MSCCILDIQVDFGHQCYLFDGLSAFVSVVNWYSLAFDILLYYGYRGSVMRGHDTFDRT